MSLFAHHPIAEAVFYHLGKNETLHITSSSYYSPNLEAPFRAVFGPESSATEAANQWTTGTPSYDVNGQFTGTYSCCSTMVDGEAVTGEWIQVESSAPHIVPRR